MPANSGGLKQYIIRKAVQGGEFAAFLHFSTMRMRYSRGFNTQQRALQGVNTPSFQQFGG